MAVFDWIQRVESLSPAALTVMAQAIDPDDTDSLVWSNFFPREDVDSIRISEVSDIDFRPVADNREWNAPGRQIPLKVPATKELKMVPTEAYFILDELEMQTLGERAGGNQERLIDIIGADIQSRVRQGARACYRRLEVNAFEAWANGNARTTDPFGGTTTVSFGFDTDRYLTAGTAWDDGGVNAYDLFLTFIEDGTAKMGATPIGAVMRRATMKVIKADAPNPFSPTSTIEMSVDQLNDKLSGDLGSAFRIVLMEHSGDVFGDAGPHNYTRTDYWPAQHVALVPPGGRIGSTKFAPVLRAAEIDRQAPDAGIDQNGVTVYHHSENDGKTLRVDQQLNVFPIPAERWVYVTDAGV
jgi:hypothetical protein